MTAANDSEELEALFDSIVAESSENKVPSAGADVSSNSDSEELQALFDSTVAVSSEIKAAASEAPPPSTSDSEELQALFDSTVAQFSENPPAAGSTDAHSTSTLIPDEAYMRIGNLTRDLHETLHQLGYSETLNKIAHSDFPEAREQLAYIANLTEQAANRTMNAVEKVQPLQDAIESQSQKLDARWKLLFDNQSSAEELKRLSADTRSFLFGVPLQAQKSNTQLIEIMMAQEFQDLTGQVIKKIIALAQKIEQEMLQLLVATLPSDKSPVFESELLNAPITHPAGSPSGAAPQEQVDDLLESLGF